MHWRRRRREHDLDRELRSHLELEAEEQQRAGLSSDEARYAAKRIIGNTTWIKEEVREMWGWRWLEWLRQDALYALRISRRTPGFTAVVILTLALGIGANTAVFSILDAALLRPLPYRNPGRLVAIWDREIHAKGPSKLFDLYSDYENWKQSSRSFEQVAGATWASPTKILMGRGPARSVLALPVTVDFFPLLGVSPALGRAFSNTDVGRGCQVVLSHSFWQSLLGARKSAIGQTLRLDSEACTILGVMPPGFAFFPSERDVSMWTLMAPPSHPERLAVAVFARLKPDVSIARAQTEVQLQHHQIHRNDLWGAQMEPVVYDLHSEFTWLTGRNLRLSLIVSFAAVSFVLLICCVNVTNLFLGRSLVRQREMAIRAALGSGRGRLIRQLLTESLLLALLASAVGTGLAVAAIRYFKIARPVDMPPAAVVTVDARVLAFTALLGVVTAVLFGLAPAARASRIDLNESLKAGGRAYARDSRQSRFGKGLIVAEVALTLLLLAGAGLMIQSLRRFATEPLGFTPDGLLVGSVRLPRTTYGSAEQRIQFYDRLRTVLSEIPGVQNAALSSSRPLQNGGVTDVVEVEGRPQPPAESLHDTYHQTISPDYFRVMGIRLEEGRYFEPTDREQTEPAAIVNEALARKYFPHESPIGKQIRPLSDRNSRSPWLTVVGLVSNERQPTVYQEMAWVNTPLIYHPLRQNPVDAMTMIARVDGGEIGVGAAIQRKIAAIDPDIPVGELQTVRDLEGKILSYPRFRAVLLASLAGLALFLAIVGLYGVLAHIVTQRTHEIGVRMALGARALQVLTLVLWEGLTPICGGIALGVAGAWLLGRYLAALLYGIRSNDPGLIAAVSLALLLAALVAMYVPARRASAVDPMVALRHE
jgi:putative ABC transport system permease protein